MNTLVLTLFIFIFVCHFVTNIEKISDTKLVIFIVYFSIFIIEKLSKID